MQYTCHSGGCPGADMEWERQGEKYGVKTIAYSFHNHVQEGKNLKILTGAELDEGWEHVKFADRTLKKNVEGLPSTYMRSLLCRNWFQVKNSDAIFAVGKFDKNRRVDGGTGWAVQMAIDNKKPVYFFDQTPPPSYIDGPRLWNYYDYTVNIFVPLTVGPVLTKNFAGIGTRALNQCGKEAIRRIYHENFCNQRV